MTLPPFFLSLWSPALRAHGFHCREGSQKRAPGHSNSSPFPKRDRGVRGSGEGRRERGGRRVSGRGAAITPVLETRATRGPYGSWRRPGEPEAPWLADDGAWDTVTESHQAEATAPLPMGHVENAQLSLG